MAVSRDRDSMERQQNIIFNYLNVIRLSNNRSFVKYWNAYLTEFTKFSKFTYAR